MKCDRCGSHFSARDAETGTRYEATSPPGRFPYTEMVTMTIGPDCAASRAGIRRFVFWIVVMVVGRSGLIALVQWWWSEL